MGKSSKHTPENVHRFVSFSQRISDINIDVIHRIRRVDDGVGESGTHFGAALGRWTDLDLTDHFLAFRKEISHQVHTYEQLVFHKEEIISSLKTHLAVPKSLAYSALLDLLVQLARDMQQDFLPHLQPFFSILVGKLGKEKQNVEVLEGTFHCIAFLFKLLWKHLVKDFKQLFSYYQQLLMSSQKEYIQVFAAESCAYLLRKVKKRNELLNFFFGSLKEMPELTDGIGLLLFEMMKGVQSQFHSVANEVFPLILYKLGPWNPSGEKTSLPKVAVEKAVTVMMQECAEHTTREGCKELWDALLKCTSQVHAGCEKVSTKEKAGKACQAHVKHLCRLLRMVSLWICHNNGKIVSNSEKVAKTLVAILRSPCLPEVLCPELLQCLAKLLTVCHDQLPMDSIVRVVSCTFSMPCAISDLQTTVMALLDTPFFEKDVLPHCMARVNTQLTDSDAECQAELLAFVTRLVLTKVQSPVCGEDIDQLQVYPLSHSRVGKQQNSFVRLIESIVDEELGVGRAGEFAGLARVWAAVVCMPHLMSVQECAPKLLRLWSQLLRSLCDGHSAAVVFVLNEIIRSLIRCGGLDDRLGINYEDILEVMRFDPTDLSCLQIVDFYLSHPFHKEALTEGQLLSIYTVLERNLASPSHNVRLLTCHILSLHPVTLTDYGDEVGRESLFHTMYTAEAIVPTLHSYREKLLQLQKLRHEFAVKCLPDEAFSKAPLLYLLGNEFWNLKLMWPPLADIIASYAAGMETDAFWEVLLGELCRAAKGSELELRRENGNPGNQSEDSSCPLASLLSSTRSSFTEDARSSSFSKYRVQLWKAMKKFPEKCVLRSDELCNLYLNFLQNEFKDADEDLRLYQNILNAESAAQDKTTASETEDKDPDEDVEMEDGEATGSRRKAATMSVLIHLDLFALFKKQRSKMNTQEVQATFFDFLTHRQGAIQKAAFECILTYRSAHITKYKQNFHRLLDDKTFKEEITLFRVDEESSQIKEEDRKELLPVLMRILYGKMRGKAGKETAGRSRTDLRRSIIFRFLGGCKPEELSFFLELLFEPCASFFTDDPLAMVARVTASVDLTKMIPLKKIKGVLNSISTVTAKLGHRIEGFGPKNLTILLGLSATLSSVLDQRHLIGPGYVNLVKGLRHAVMDRVTQFFECYEDLEFTDSQLLAVFAAVVWPYTGKLEFEGIHHPTPLLKLFICWSKSYRLLPLLGHSKVGPDGRHISPLSSMFALLNAPTVADSVSSAILDIVGQLLLTEEEWDLEELPVALPDSFALSDQAADSAYKGQSLLHPHVPQLLTYLHSRLKKISRSNSGKKLNLTSELKILARVSSFVTSPGDCQTLCSLLVPFLRLSSFLSEDTEANTLQSLSNLIAFVEDPFSFYRVTCQLFGQIERRQSRALLCKLFKAMSSRKESLHQVAQIIENLNSWDRSRAEEPNYTARLDAFQQMNAIVNAMQAMDDEMLLPVVYNCCFFIRAVDDLSIRDNSTFCIVSMVKKMADVEAASFNSKAYQALISECLVRMVKAGIKHKAEAVRHEFLAILQCLVNTYPKSPMFAGFEGICDKDPEADFFENIRHIQMHKRSRALRRLHRFLFAHTMRTELHISYFIPLAHTFATEPSFAKYANVQDAAIDVLAAICKQLPWGAFYHLLQSYLNLLPKKVEVQRQIIRIIVALLEGFHFDLSHSVFSDKVTPKLEGQGNSENSVKDTNADGAKEGEKSEELGKESEQTGAKDVEEELGEIPTQEEPGTEEDNASNVEPMDVETSSEAESSKTGFTVCSQATATKIHTLTATVLLPKLHAIITERAKSETEHKSVRSKYPEDTEILRVPIALAMVKLLQNLPKKTMENRLPGIFLKICYFLRSRSREIRTTARETLEKAALSLGARYFPFILKELRASLTRGYQLHVLNFTTHHLLKSLVDVVTPGDLDPAIADVQQIFHSEFFGHVAEEKEVKAIKAKFFEAKFIKGYDAYHLLSRSILPSSLNKLIEPVKEVLMTTHNKRLANKAEILLKKVADGLLANRAIPLTAMMVFINSLTVKLTAQLEQDLGSKPQEQPAPQHRLAPDCLLLERAAPRGGHKPKASRKTNVHVLVEFGLQLLCLCLKRSSLVPTEELHLQMLDPLIPAIRDSLTDSHERTNSGALRCLAWLLKFPLPSLKADIDKVVQGMFLVLKSHAHTAVAKGDSQELITTCFKAVTVLVKEVQYYRLTSDQLHVLLVYCEEDLYNYARQSTAFSLIRAILSRKLDTSQVHEVVAKVFTMSITSPAANTRKDSRQVVLYYLMNYPQGTKLKDHLYFYIDHLNYELEEGRMSALELMIDIFSSFPLKTLHDHCHKFFVALAMASYNDASTKCRKLVLVALKMLLGKIAAKMRRELFKEVLKWINSSNRRIRAMGCQICGLFVEVEGGRFSSHQRDVVPLLRQKLDPELLTLEEDSKYLEEQDLCLVATLHALVKIARELNVIRTHKFAADVSLLWGYLSSHLLYPHIQVRLAACQLLGLMFSAWEPSDVVRMGADGGDGACEPMESDGHRPNGEAAITASDANMKSKSPKKARKESIASQIESVKPHGQKKKIGKPLDQVGTPTPDQEADATETMQELKDKELAQGDRQESQDEDGDDGNADNGSDGEARVGAGQPNVKCYLATDTEQKIKTLTSSLCKQLQTANIVDALATQIVKNLLYLARLAEAAQQTDLLIWLAKKVMREANLEVIYDVRTPTRRNYAFKWVAAVGVTLQPESIQVLLHIVLPALQRQLAEDARDEELKMLAQEVVDLLKKKVGVETFTQAFVASQRAQVAKRDIRKRQFAEEAVVNPVLAARKKLKNNLKKRDAKKRKMEERRPTKRVKKSKLSILNVKVDED